MRRACPPQTGWPPGNTAHLRHEVQRIDPAARQLTVCDLATGRVFTDRYDKLVVATGSSNLIPQVPGCHRVGVQTLRTVEDLIFLKEYTRTPYVQDVVILGGGWSGLEIAKAFHKMGRRVRIIEKEQQILPRFDPEVSRLIQGELQAQGIQLSLGEQVRAFPGRTFIEQVQTNRGSYPCDLCIVTIGVQPNTVLLRGTGAELASGGAVLIDQNLATSGGNLRRGRLCPVPPGQPAYRQHARGKSGDRPHRPDRNGSPARGPARQKRHGYGQRPPRHLPSSQPHHHQARV